MEGKMVAAAAAVVAASMLVVCSLSGAHAMPIQDELRKQNGVVTTHLASDATERLSLKSLLLLDASIHDTTPNLGLSPSPNGFELELGVRGVQYSAAAYCSNSTVKDWTCKPCERQGLPALDDIRVFYAKKTATYGYVGLDHANKFIVVAFQGTHNLKQWIDDLKFFKTDLQYPGAPPDVEVHSGFYKAYQEVKSTVDHMVKETHAQHGKYRILVTGHSLGAAIAAMCSLDLSIAFPDAEIYHYTFGQPRVGNKPFYAFFAGAAIQESFRFVHNRDIVPHLPLKAMGFHHIATEVFYKENYNPNQLQVCDGSGEDPGCSDQFSIDISVSDHLNYLGFTVDTDACH